MNKLKKCIALIAVLVMTVIFFVPASAETIDQSRDCSMTCTYKSGDTVIPDASFSLYYVANISARGDAFVPVGKFKNYPVSWSFTDNGMMSDTALTLAGYAALDGLLPAYTGVTDENGVVSFPGEDRSMLPGLYLITGERVYSDEDVYDCIPSLVTLPYYNANTGEWIYDLQVLPKVDHDQAHSDTDTVNCSVLKIWAGDEKHPEARPKSIKVLLLRDGKLFDTKELSAENNWRYTWEKLSAKHYWVAVESENDAYNVLVSRNGDTFLIKNTYVPPEEQTTVPDETTTSPDEPTTGPGETTTTPDETTTGPDETTTSPEGTTSPEEPTTKPIPDHELPNTGMLWWPVTVLAIAGLLLFIIGWAILRRYEYDDV